MDNEIKCPFCGSNNIKKVNKADDETFAIPLLKTNSNHSDMPTKYLPVKAFGCASCKAIFFICESFREH